ncbi:hypothetical protein FM104_06175 [Microbacterium esteraromaticum]|uniref:Uncharacterized protein n=1 Tax=Microbacterium esteraromaticum TaxID=57043 RepID=A0A1R4J999_9MICO|nr:hypothetical protein FM104_06175 [Microbacterium esteraromaticum]
MISNRRGTGIADCRWGHEAPCHRGRARQPLRCALGTALGRS